MPHAHKLAICSAAANELDARGINRDTTQQKLAEVGQTMKDYGAVGQQRAGEYFNQAVDQVSCQQLFNPLRLEFFCFFSPTQYAKNMPAIASSLVELVGFLG